MNEISPIYQNDFGIAFQWKQDKTQKTNKVQLIFRDIGLLLTPTFAVSFQEVVEIKDLIKGTLFKLQLDSFFDEMGID